MITRVWRGWAQADGAHEYERHYQCEVLVVADEARAVLVRFDNQVVHYETAVETS